MRTLRIWFVAVLRWLYWFPLRFIVHNIPISLLPLCGRMGGTILFYLSIERKKRLLEGIKYIWKEEFDSKRVKQIAIKTFQHNFQNAIENLLCDKLSPNKIEELIEFEGLEHLSKALDSGRGVILMHGHFGNEELIMPAIGFKGFKMNQMASRWQPELIKGRFLFLPNLIFQRIFRLKIGIRERYPIRFIYIDRFIRDAFRCLKRNEILAIAIDGREGNRWIVVDFMGRKGLFSPGPMSIALKTGAPIIPVFILRQNGYRHRLIFHKPFLVEGGRDREVDIVNNTQRFVKLMEEYIIRYPCHYMKLFWVDAQFFVGEEWMN